MSRSCRACIWHVQQCRWPARFRYRTQTVAMMLLEGISGVWQAGTGTIRAAQFH